MTNAPKMPWQAKPERKRSKGRPRYTWKERTQNAWRKEGLNRTE